MSTRTHDTLSTELEKQLNDLCQRVPELDEGAAAAARDRLDRLSKPPGSLGVLEEVIAHMAAITGHVRPRVKNPAVLVAAGDHGVVAEGVSPYPQIVSVQMVLNFLGGGAAINALAKNADARVIVVDAGVANDLPDHPRLRRAGVRRGTGNMMREPAMTRDEAARAMLEGARIVAEEAESGLDLLALGEMGIGNTTAAAALTCAYTKSSPQIATGRGTGLDDAGVEHKRAVIAAALQRAQVETLDPLSILAEVGGLEHALLAGATIEAASRRIPVMLDGYVATSAALAAAALAPQSRSFMIAGHRSAEPGHRISLDHLGLRPLLMLDMRLGEGSGAALAISIVQAATRVMDEMATLDEAGVDDRDDK